MSYWMLPALAVAITLCSPTKLTAAEGRVA